MDASKGELSNKVFFQCKQYQCFIFTGFDSTMISPMCAVIDHYVDHIDLSCFDQYVKSNKVTGGRPAISAKSLLKIYMYSLHCGISLRQLNSKNSVGSELAFLANDEKRFPNRISLTRFLALLPKHIDSIFSSTLSYIHDQGVELDFTIIYIFVHLLTPNALLN